MKKLNFLSALFILFFSTALFSSPYYDYTGGHGHGHGKGGDNKKIFVGVGLGLGIPMGNFGKKDTLGHNDTTHITGWAKPGFHFHVAGGYMFSDNVGAMISIGGNMNGFDTKTYMTVYGYGSGSTVTATSHYTGSYLVGPAFLFPAGDKIGIHAHVLVGLMTSKYSSVTETLPAPFNVTSVSTFTPVKTFGYDAGAALIIHASDALGITIGADYLGGTPKFTTETYTIGSSTNSSSGHSLAMSTGLINITAGIMLGF